MSVSRHVGQTWPNTGQFANAGQYYCCIEPGKVRGIGSIIAGTRDVEEDSVSELEMRLGAQFAMQEQSRLSAESAQRLGEQAIQETRQLQMTQQTTTQELTQSVKNIELKL